MTPKIDPKKWPQKMTEKVTQKVTQNMTHGSNDPWPEVFGHGGGGAKKKKPCHTDWFFWNIFLEKTISKILS